MLEQGSIDKPLSFDAALIQLSCHITVLTQHKQRYFQSKCYKISAQSNHAKGLHFIAFHFSYIYSQEYWETYSMYVYSVCTCVYVSLIQSRCMVKCPYTHSQKKYTLELIWFIHILVNAPQFLAVEIHIHVYI